MLDAVPLAHIAADVPTPAYVYSLPRALGNLRRIQAAFAELNPHIHYSVKANANLALLRALVQHGAGLDVVSGGEIHRALAAGCAPSEIVFAGVGKTNDELRYALSAGVGWLNVENADEIARLQALCAELGTSTRVALRLNPEVAADTHKHIATGHGKAKFGMTLADGAALLAQQADFPLVRMDGVHIHIGSNLRSTASTTAAVQAALDVIAPFPQVRTINVGGGLPSAYTPTDVLPSFADFAAAVTPLLRGYEVMLEPGRAIIADAGVLLTRVLYLKQHGDGSSRAPSAADGVHTFVIVDASMSELIRPALYEAHHEIVAVQPSDSPPTPYTVVGPVCETTDVLGHDVPLAAPQVGDLLAILTAGAYGMVMSSNYNQRPRPPEVLVNEDGATWRITRRRETFDDLLRYEVNL
jgi:diaminopimelate decarboxylase